MPFSGGHLVALFTSFQGEGPRAGELHHFIRLAGCRAGCVCCDTPEGRGVPDRYRFPDREGGKNPVTAYRAAGLVAELDRRRPLAQALAVTGGEPLEQADFLEAFLPAVKVEVLEGRPVLLETNGLHPGPMKRLASLVDQVSMDWKLESSSGLQDSLPVHEDFLAALGEASFYVKAVVNERTTAEEVGRAAACLARSGRDPLLVLQPQFREGARIGGYDLLALWEGARAHLRQVRILPQIHRILSVE